MISPCQWPYVDQSSWQPRDFGQLNAYFNRIFLYEETDEIKSNAVKALDLTRMSDITKAIIYANLTYYEILDKMIQKYPNLEELYSVKPLEKPVYLTPEPYNIFQSYRDMNLML